MIRVLAAPVLLLLAALPAAALRTLQQPMADFVTDVRTFMPQEGSMGYVVPTPTERTAFATAIAALQKGDVSTAEAAISQFSGFELIDFTDGPGGPEYWVLAEVPPLQKGWGFYFLARHSTRPALLVEAPHPLADRESELSAVAVVQQLRPQAFLLAGAHRYADPAHRSDMAHTSLSVFEAVHEALLTSTSMTLQIHGFADAAHPGYPDLVLSNSTTTPDEVGRSICASVARAGIVCQLFDGVSYTDLGATANVQAGASNRTLGVGHFLHFETAEVLRNNPERFGHLVDAMAAAIPAPVQKSKGCAGVPATSSGLLGLFALRCRRRVRTGRGPTH